MVDFSTPHCCHLSGELLIVLNEGRLCQSDAFTVTYRFVYGNSGKSSAIEQGQESDDPRAIVKVIALAVLRMGRDQDS